MRLRELVKLPQGSRGSRNKMQHDIACAVLDTIQDVTLPAVMEYHCRPFAQNLPVAEDKRAAARIDAAFRKSFGFPEPPNPRRLENFRGGGRKKKVAAVGVYEQAFFRGLRQGCDRFVRSLRQDDGGKGGASQEARRVRAHAGAGGVVARRHTPPPPGGLRVPRNGARGSRSSFRPLWRNSSLLRSKRRRRRATAPRPSP